jgi:hypothetical protein
MSPPAHGPGLFHAVGLFGYEASGIAPHTLGRTWISPVEVTTDPKCVAAFGLQRFGGPWATGTIDPASASAAVHSVGMFIRYLLDLPLPFEDADARLHTAPEFWVPGLARDAEGGGAHLLAEVGFPVDDHRVGKEVQIWEPPSASRPGPFFRSRGRPPDRRNCSRPSTRSWRSRPSGGTGPSSRSAPVPAAFWRGWQGSRSRAAPPGRRGDAQGFPGSGG